MRILLLPLLAPFMTAAADPRPVRLEATPSPAGVEVRVVGLSESAVEARYTLEVSSGASGNRSVQGGRARLAPGQQAVLIRLKLGGSGSGQDWQARLRVEPVGGASYEEVARATEPTQG